MNIIHVEDFFHPDAGYQINILPKYMVNEGHQVTIITTKMETAPEGLTSFFGKHDIENRDQIYTKKTGVKIIRLNNRGFISGRAVFSKELFKVINDINPDVIYVHGNDTLTAIRLLLKFKNKNIPIVLDSHMLEMASINKFNKLFRNFYKKVITPIIIKKQIPVIRTQNDNYVEKYLGIPLQQAPWISFGSDLLLFHPDKNVRKEFRKEYEINEDDFVVLYTGKLDEAKGGLILANSFKANFKENKNVVLVVVGNTSGDYGKQVDKILSESQNRVIRFETQKYMDLPKFYQAADISIFPTQCSLSFFDAQACGLPVLSENNNINKDRLKYDNGFTFNSADIHDIRDKVITVMNMPVDNFEKMRRNSVEYVNKNYNYNKIAVEYLNILEGEVRKVYAVE
ncbi:MULTISPECIES: glycosyltransferase family 4 protein [unclassified Exiguobacterium]|uniref:glycosyltransferase family 4 protein n=1 Tax=unclassified Exiguobacterium TaxID=2644629 RepID=UPI00103F69F7|nr:MULTISPECIES: glycosyltransferase family 4 protein [unclassified Exiguobacterium]TCI71258.1 glycosyltransferase [Exiguobacterium sp. IPCI3]TCI81236.1 glycosyltransferase [Exiguobacterium sp. IPCH1]TCI82433.1 glycosyltransferase [Exiguobacterium sp. IPBC4]